MRVALASLLGLLPAHAVEPGIEILLWPNGKTGNTVIRIAERSERVLSNIHKPSLTPYLPAVDEARVREALIKGGLQNFPI